MWRCSIQLQVWSHASSRTTVLFSYSLFLLVAVPVRMLPSHSVYSLLLVLKNFEPQELPDSLATRRRFVFTTATSGSNQPGFEGFLKQQHLRNSITSKNISTITTTCSTASPRHTAWFRYRECSQSLPRQALLLVTTLFVPLLTAPARKLLY